MWFRSGGHRAQWWWGWHGRAGPGDGVDSGRARAGGWQRNGAGSGWKSFFYPALGQQDLHGALRAAAIHVGGGGADEIQGAGGIGEQQTGMLVLAPEPAQGAVGAIRQGHEAVLVALAAANVDLMLCGIDIAHFKGQGLAQAQAHGIGGEDKDAIAQLASGGNDAGDLIGGEDIGQGLDLGRFDDVEPGPIELEDVLPKEAQAIALNLHGAPGMGIDQGGKVQFQLFDAELIGETIEVRGQASHGAGVAIDGGLAIAVQFQQPQVMSIQRIEAFLFIGIHW